MPESDDMHDKPATPQRATGATGQAGLGDQGAPAAGEHPNRGGEAWSEAQPALPEEVPVLPASDVRAILEALVFASPNPVTPREIRQVLTGVDEDAWRAAMEELKLEYAREARGLQLVEVAGGFQITTRPEYNDWVRELLSPRTPSRLSIQALETLAVIAYKQPVTLPEIIELRGVKSGGVIKTLLEKHLIRIVGRKEVVGRPMLYGTTKDFLLHFGLKDLGDLPKIEEFAEVLGEEVDVAGLKKAIEAPRPTEAPLADDEGESAGTLAFDAAPDAADRASEEAGAGDDDADE
jgi:segregation and condensation protein B